MRITALFRRWPAAVAVGSAALITAGGTRDENVTALSETLLLLPLIYLVVAKLGRPAATWPVLLATTPVLFLQSVDVIAPAAAIVAVALIVLVWGGIDGQLTRSAAFQVQTLGMLAFGGLGLAALAVDTDLGRYLVAAGWLLHGIWDFVHLKRGAVVARSYAEWCGVLDVLIAAWLLFVL